MKKVVKKCGTCRFLRPRDDGKPFYHSHAYPCLWQPPAIDYPASWQYHRSRHQNGNVGMHMEPGAGSDCPCWEAIKPADGADSNPTKVRTQ